MRRIVLVSSAFGLLLSLTVVQGCGSSGDTTGVIQDTAERKKIDTAGSDAMKEFMQSKTAKKAK
jgi:hypothetical protein